MIAEPLMRASDRLFRFLLHLYPADFREEMGRALLETYHDRVKEALIGGSVFRLAGIWCAALLDSLRNGLGERLRPAVSWRRTGNWGRDLELVSRRLRRTPLLVAAILGTLTIGLGTFAVVYTAVDKILIEPLPYEHPEDLYMVWRKSEKFVITGPEAAELRMTGGVIERTAILRPATATLSASEDTDALPLVGMSVSPELFDVLRVEPALGRGFRPEETGPNSPNVMVLTDRLWKHLGAKPDIIGSLIKVSGQAFTVIGVMPADFRFEAADSRSLDFLIPLYDDLPVQPPLVGDWMALLRARHGAPASLVQDVVDRISLFIDERVNKGERRGLRVVGLQADLVEEVRPALIALGFAGVFLALILTVNLASILLARAAEREKEFAVARALGASGPAVVRATVIEGSVLGFLGGAGAVLAATWGTRLLVSLGPADLPRRETIAVDWRIAAVVIALGALLGFIAATAPAIWASRVSLPSLLAAAGVRGGATTSRMRRGLIVAQIALSMILLSAGGLVVRSFEELIAADPGFRSKGVLTFRVGLGNWLFPKEEESYAFQDRVANEIGALPGVRRVSATSNLPLAGGGSISWVFLPKRDPDGIAGYRLFVRAGYFETMGIRLIAGRTFETTHHKGVHEALIDRQMARYFFPDRSPIGATLMCDERIVTVVGVVEQPRTESLHRDDTHPQIFLRAEDYSTRPPLFAVLTDGNPSALAREVRGLVRRIDRRVPVADIRTMDEIVADRRSRERISAVLIAGLALGALLLVAMGLFGVISGSVLQRRGELAVRVALGATHGGVLRLVVGEGARLVLRGLMLGLPGIYIAGQALSGLLINTSPFDLPTLSAVALGLVAVALLACYLAARRVTTIDPAALLRDVG